MKFTLWYLALPILSFVFAALNWLLPSMACFGLWCGICGWDLRDGQAQLDSLAAEWDALIERAKKVKQP